MDIQLNNETLGGKSLLVGTPMYGGQCYHEYLHGLLELQHLCLQYEIPIKLVSTSNISLVQEARNHIVNQFLETEYTHLLFIDADVGFKAIEVIAMLATGKQIIGGAYPRKTINWNNVKEVISKNPDIDPSLLPSVTGMFPIIPVDVNAEYSSADIIKVKGTGTGLMIIERDVFKQFREAYPDYYYSPDVDSYQLKGEAKKIELSYSYFNVGITEVDDGGEIQKVNMGEDYKFCYMCRKIGIDIWFAPFTNTTHTGTYAFSGSIGALAKYSNGGLVN
jgi:hypothetical protein